jgi:hypothetical protein
MRKVINGELGISGIDVSVYDFGGQNVFNCLHPFFLTRFGVCIVVFDMTWLIDEESTRAVEALSHLSFWLNSVVLNTKREGGSAPLVLVGTHKDTVADSSAHERISAKLSNTFYGSSAWPFILKYDRSNLVFFPVDCTQQENDEAIKDLRKAVETLLSTDMAQEASPTKVKRPLSWYQALDALNAVGVATPSITFDRAATVLLSCGIVESDIKQVLADFRDMGMLMWYDEKALRDVVILDPVASFVKPVSKIICDPGLHCEKAHGHFKLHYQTDYSSMIEKGIVSQTLLTGLLRYEGKAGDCTVLTALMVKYGLLVSWKLRDSGNVIYLVPALFPLDPTVSKMIDTADQAIWAVEQPVTTVYIVFSLCKTLPDSCLTIDLLTNKCFLPSGLFDRLICALLKWSWLFPSVDPDNFRLRKNVVELQIAGIIFRLVWRSDSNCIELSTTCGTPITLIERVEIILARLIEESIQSLYFQSFVRHADLLIPVKACMPSRSSYVFPSFEDGREVNIDGAAVGQAHPWLWSPRSTAAYDVFLSHRWGAPDDELVLSVFDQLSDYVVDDLPISIFYDDRHMEHGHRIDHEFFRALLRSSVMVPLVSMNALQRMLNSDPADVDDVLVEWLTALVFVRFSSHLRGLVSLRQVVPIVSKELDGSDYFSVRKAGLLPNSVPTESCKAVLALFEQANISLPTDVTQFVNTVTVKDIVFGIMRWKCVTADKSKRSLQDLASECVTTIMEVVLHPPTNNQAV